MKCTQVCCEENTVNDILSAGTKLEPVDRAESKNVRDVETVREQLASIGHLKRICLARSTDDLAVLAGL